MMILKPISPGMFVRRIARDRRGATIVEFAAVAPILALLLMGGFDIAYQQYVKSVLEGEVSKAGRDSALETGGTTTRQSTIDTRVETTLHDISRDATVEFSRRSFASYDRVASPGEPFVDGNGDGVCNNGESYEDSNRNGVFNATDGGTDGFTGAKDAIVYTATVTYPRLFPMGRLLGWSDEVTMSASTVLKIQPFTARAAVPTLSCT